MHPFLALVLTAFLVVVPKTEGSSGLVGVFRQPLHQSGIHEIILYRNGAEYSGVWVYGWEKTYFATAPLEGASLGPGGELVFSVPFIAGTRAGKVVYRHSFKGRLSGDVIQGKFESTPSSTMRPAELSKAERQTRQSLGKDPLDYYYSRKQAADEAKRKMNAILACHAKRAVPPGGVPLFGYWGNVAADGEHESGYEVALFKNGEKLEGWIEDFEGLVGDGGVRMLLSSVVHDPSTGKIDLGTSVGRRYTGRIQGANLVLNQTETLKNYGSLPTQENERLWMEFQNLVVKCE